MQRLHVPRREGLSLYVPSAHLTHRDSSLGEQTVKDPAGHSLQDRLDNLGELPLSDCENTGGVQQQRNQFCRIKLCFPEKKQNKTKQKALNGGGEGRGRGRGGKGEREGRAPLCSSLFYASMFTPAKLAFKIKKENISFEFSW